MAIIRIHIEPKILIWAIHRAGKDVDEYKAKNSNFCQWLDGTKQPTLREIEDFARKYYLPLGYMFLKEPLREECPIPFFRSKAEGACGINVRDTVDTMQERQEWLSGYLKNGGFSRSPLAGSAKGDSVDVVVCKLHDMLELPSDWALGKRNVEEALKYLTTLVEERGVIVCFNGVVGNKTTRPIPVEECRGFTLMDDYAPFVFINGRDAKSAQMFTFVHELAHVLIGYSAGFGDSEEDNRTTKEERFCDRVAASFLLPESLFREQWNMVGDNYEVLAKRFKVSRYVIARRAKEMNLITDASYWELIKKWETERPIVLKKRSGGNFNSMVINRTSRTFLAHVNGALGEGKLLHMDAYRLTGLRGSTFHKVINSKEFVR